MRGRTDLYIGGFAVLGRANALLFKLKRGAGMNTIIYDARRVKALGRLQELAAYTGREEAFVESLWKELVADGDFMKEFVYYLDNHTFLDELKCEGYGLTDLYVWMLERYNLMQDYGKNGPDCDKEGLVLDTFHLMAEMRKNPEAYIKWLEGGFGMDKRL